MSPAAFFSFTVLISSTGDMLNTDLILRRRLEWLMQSMSAISSTLNLSSPSYFSKLFFRQFGISPKDFEKQCRDSDRGGMA